MRAVLRSLVPYRRFVLVTRLAPAEVRAALAAVVRPAKASTRASDDRPFQGEVLDDGFTIVRRASIRTTFVPVVRGWLETDAVGTRVHVNMRLHAPMAVFLIVWLATAMLAAGLATFAAIHGGPTGPLGAWVLPPLIGVLAASTFGIEANRATFLLRLLLQAEEHAEAHGQL